MEISSHPVLKSFQSILHPDHTPPVLVSKLMNYECYWNWMTQKQIDYLDSIYPRDTPDEPDTPKYTISSYDGDTDDDMRNWLHEGTTEDNNGEITGTYWEKYLQADAIVSNLLERERKKYDKKKGNANLKRNNCYQKWIGLDPVHKEQMLDSEPGRVSSANKICDKIFELAYFGFLGKAVCLWRIFRQEVDKIKEKHEQVLGAKKKRKQAKIKLAYLDGYEYIFDGLEVFIKLHYGNYLSCLNLIEKHDFKKMKAEGKLIVCLTKLRWVCGTREDIPQTIQTYHQLMELDPDCAVWFRGYCFYRRQLRLEKDVYSIPDSSERKAAVRAYLIDKTNPMNTAVICLNMAEMLTNVTEGLLVEAKEYKKIKLFKTEKEMLIFFNESAREVICHGKDFLILIKCEDPFLQLADAFISLPSNFTNFKLANKCIECAFKVNPSSAAVMHRKALLTLKQHPESCNKREAEKLLRQVLEKYWEELDTMNTFSALYDLLNLLLSDVDNNSAQIQELLNTNIFGTDIWDAQQISKFYFLKGCFNFCRKDYQAALDAWIAAIKLDSTTDHFKRLSIDVHKFPWNKRLLDLDNISDKLGSLDEFELDFTDEDNCIIEMIKSKVHALIRIKDNKSVVNDDTVLRALTSSAFADALTSGGYMKCAKLIQQICSDSGEMSEQSQLVLKCVKRGCLGRTNQQITKIIHLFEKLTILEPNCSTWFHAFHYYTRLLRRQNSLESYPAKKETEAAIKAYMLDKDDPNNMTTYCLNLAENVRALWKCPWKWPLEFGTAIFEDEGEAVNLIKTMADEIKKKKLDKEEAIENFLIVCEIFSSALHFPCRDLNLAMEYLNKVLEIRPQSVPALHRKALLILKQDPESRTEAEEILRELCETTKYRSFYVLYDLLNLLLADVEENRIELQELLNTNIQDTETFNTPQISKLYFLKGCLNFLQGDFVYAFEDWVEALKLDSKADHFKGLSLAISRFSWNREILCIDNILKEFQELDLMSFPEEDRTWIELIGNKVNALVLPYSRVRRTDGQREGLYVPPNQRAGRSISESSDSAWRQRGTTAPTQGTSTNSKYVPPHARQRTASTRSGRWSESDDDGSWRQK